jgi:hypothetical protein
VTSRKLRLTLLVLLIAVRASSADADRVPYSPAALYNLGNAYAREAKPGLAVLNYERALLLAPDDPDLAANLDAVRRHEHIDLERRKGVTRLVGRLNPDLCAWLGVAGVLLGCAATLAGRFGSRGRGLRFVFAIGGMLLVAVPVLDAAVLWPALHAAVVVATTPLRAAPVPLGDVVATLPEAVTVRVVDEHEEFVLVEAPGDRRGWVARADLGFVVR